MRPAILLLRIIAITAAVEFLLMIGPFPFRALRVEGALLNAALLAAIAAPFLYVWVVKGTAEQLAEASASREAQSKFRILLDAVAEGAVFVDGDGRITHVNRMAEELFDFERTELIHQPVEVLVPERYRERHVGHRDRYIKDPAAVPLGIGREFTARRRDGSEFPFELSLSPIEGPGEARVLALVTDISERRRAESERFLLSLAVDHIAESVIITDTEGTIQYVNPAFERITGYTRGEAIGSNARILKSGEHDDAFFEKLWTTVETGDVWKARLVNRRKDGTLFEQDTMISAIRDLSGDITHYVSAGREDLPAST